MEKDVIRYVSVAESWLHELDFSSKREAVVIAGEALRTGKRVMRVRYILRPTKGKPVLGPPQNWDDARASGRFARMFEPEPGPTDPPTATRH